MTPNEEDRLAALNGLYQAERAQLSALSAQAVTLYSMAVAYSAAVAAVWSSGHFEISSDWSRALILALPAPAAMILGYRAVLGAAVAGHTKAATEYESHLLAAAGYPRGQDRKVVPMLGLQVDSELGDLRNLWRSRANRPGLFGSAALFYAIGVVVIAILTVVCLVRTWPCGHSWGLWVAWACAFVLYVGAAWTLSVAWCQGIPKI
jgi:uncharacterized protein YfiM (DUF2279 family)